MGQIYTGDYRVTPLRVAPSPHPLPESELELQKQTYREQGAVAESVGSPGSPDWQEKSNCLGVDPDLFFPERGESLKPAIDVCAACVVKEECLEYALENGEKFGVWGGESERSRRRMRRTRNLARTVLDAEQV